MAYANGKIYALRTHKGEEVYVGSTTTSLEERFRDHKKKGNRCNSKSLFEKYDDVYFELIELFPCETKTQLHKREGEIMLGFGDKAVNKQIAGRTDQEYWTNYRAKYYVDNREKTLESAAKYYADNREKQLESAANYRAKNREKNLEYAANYRAENREKVKEQKAKYSAKKKAEAAAQSSSQSGVQMSFSVIITHG
jgi:hypothetical protein